VFRFFKARAHGAMVRAIFAFLRWYMRGREVWMESNKAVQTGTVTGSRVEWARGNPVPVDLSFFWVPEGGDISDVKQVSYARLHAANDDKGKTYWRFIDEG